MEMPSQDPPRSHAQSPMFHSHAFGRRSERRASQRATLRFGSNLPVFLLSGASSGCSGMIRRLLGRAPLGERVCEETQNDCDAVP